MTDPILDNLNPQQYAAVTAPDGPLLIVAGAGTGKTRVITRRLAFLVRERGVRPWQIYAATFTNKSAEEMRHRVADLSLGSNPADFHISTFHSMCAKILRCDGGTMGLESNFTICDAKDQQSAVRHVMAQLQISDKIVKPADAQNVINQAKMRMLGPSDLEPVSADNHELYGEIYEKYENYLKDSCAVDFEDLLLKSVQLFDQNPGVLEKYQQKFRYLMVDEYQDTNKVQVELVSLLARDHRNLTVVGDEDQSIYSWRGADITNLLDFQKHFPDAELIRLEQNYRSTGNILKAADAVISINTERLGKTLFTEGEEGPPIYVAVGRSETEEAEAVVFSIEELRKRGFKLSEMAIFYRVAALSRVFEDALRRFQIPYRMIGGTKFYDRAEIKDLVSYMQVAANPGNSIALQRVINTPRRGLGNKSIETVAEYASRKRISFYEAMRAACSGTDVGLPKAGVTKFARFLEQVEAWRKFAKDSKPSDLLDRILKDTAYVESLGDPHSIEVMGRRDNLEELRTSIITMEGNRPDITLTDYLEDVSLVSVTDDLDPNEAAVSLMTLHAAKGLEYKVVFMVGVEESLFPNHRAAIERGNYEEERRLFYVGITRAREFLVLSRAAERMYYGERRYNDESRFFHELPADIIRPLHPYNPMFHDTAEDAPKDLDLGYPISAPAAAASRGFSTPRYAQPRTPFGRGPAPAAPSRPYIEPAVRGRSFPLGTRVRHMLLGEGVIASVSGNGAELEYIIEMDDGMQHHLIARYAKLEALPDE